jgi:hypothetical protein
MLIGSLLENLEQTSPTNNNPNPDTFRCYGRHLDTPLGDLSKAKHVLLFIGGESAILLNLLLTYNEISVCDECDHASILFFVY